MATQMQLEVILAGNRIATRFTTKEQITKRKAEIVSVSVFSRVLNVLSCPKIWNIEQEKDREKEKVGGRPAKLNDKKGDRDLEREKNNMKILWQR